MQLPTDAGLTAEMMWRLARRLESNPDFLAAVFRRYQDAQRFDDAHLAAHLGIAPADLPRLAICRRPRHDATDPGRFRMDVEAIAEHFEISSFVLADVVRFVDVLDVATSAPTGAVSAGFLAAARERAAEERAGYDAEPDDDNESGDDR